MPAQWGHFRVPLVSQVGPFLSAEYTIRRPDWQPDESVTIVTGISDDDQARIVGAGVCQEHKGEDSVTFILAMHELTQTTLEVGVVGWSFYWLSDEGDPASARTPIPLTPENLAQLSQEDRAWIAAAITEEWAATPTDSVAARQ